MSLVPLIKNSQKTDHVIPKEGDKNVNGLVWKRPSRAIFVGSTGSGKTNCMNACIGHQARWRPWKKIYLMSANVESAQKGEWQYLDVTPLTEWPPLKFFEDVPGEKLLICDDNALIGLSSKGGVDSQRMRADRIVGHGSTHCNLSVYIAQQMMVNVPPNIRRLASHFVLFPHRIAHDSIPLVAKSCMVEKKHMYQLFDWTKQTGDYAFILITNEPDGRHRVRLNGERDVLGIN